MLAPVPRQLVVAATLSAMMQPWWQLAFMSSAKKKKNSGNDILTKLVTDQHIPIMQLLEAVSPRIFFFVILVLQKIIGTIKNETPQKKKIAFLY